MADLDELDATAAEADVFAAGDALVAEAPEFGAVVFECTNMAPYACSLSARLGLPVYDIVSLITWLYGGHRPRAWA
jgi:glyoxylase-like metal-dependent hydrolase (beta-lactamase superfamily II)